MIDQAEMRDVPALAALGRCRGRAGRGCGRAAGRGHLRGRLLLAAADGAEAQRADQSERTKHCKHLFHSRTILSKKKLKPSRPGGKTAPGVRSVRAPKTDLRCQGETHLSRFRKHER